MNETKICKDCGKELPLTDFSYSEVKYKDKRYPHYRSHCKTCENIRRYSKINEFKSEYHCLVCGETDITCLDFHHLDPSKKEFCISTMLRNKRFSIKKIKEELDKCICLCANCHRKFHAYGWKYVNGCVIKND